MPLNFSNHWNYTDISVVFQNLTIFLRSVKLWCWLELVPSRLLSFSCLDDPQMLNSRRSCLTSPIVTDGRIYIPSTVSSGDEYILLLHSKYRTEISTKHFCLSAPATIWHEQGRSSAPSQAPAVPPGRSCHEHTPECWGALGLPTAHCGPRLSPCPALPCTHQPGSLLTRAAWQGAGADPWPLPSASRPSRQSGSSEIPHLTLG